MFFFNFFREKKTQKNEVILLRQESLSTTSICQSGDSVDSDSGLKEIKRFNIDESKKLNNNNNKGIFDCFGKCLDMFKNKKDNSLLEK